MYTTKIRRSLRLGLIGAGKWGKNYIRTIGHVKGVNLHRIASSNPDIGSFIPSGTLVSINWEDLINENDIDGLIVSVPPAAQSTIAIAALNKKIPLLLEKPLSLDVISAKEISALAEDNDVLVMVNHIFLYHPGFIKLKEKIMVDSSIKSIRSVSGNIGPFRNEWSPLWDWGPHDLSMCLSLVEEKVNITNVFHETDKFVDRGRNYSVNLQFESGINAKLYFGNGFSKKTKIFSVVTETSEYVFNDLAQDKLTVKKNKGDKKKVNFENILPLNNVIKEFKNSIINYNNYSSQFELAVDVVKLLTKIEKKLDEYAPKR